MGWQPRLNRSCLGVCHEHDLKNIQHQLPYFHPKDMNYVIGMGYTGYEKDTKKIQKDMKGYEMIRKDTNGYDKI